MAQWQALELKWLSEEHVKTLDAKYISITDKLDAHIATLKAQHEIEQQRLAQQQRQVLALATLEALSEEIENALQLGLETPKQTTAISLMPSLGNDSIVASVYGVNHLALPKRD